ncbi:hypothetical protein B0H13DRAFT_1885843 [Mycena leptocephala]|nr:hypothetical protein B0H13DRAFT_1885843 [Mycena leptocephala]
MPYVLPTPFPLSRPWWCLLGWRNWHEQCGALDVLHSLRPLDDAEESARAGAAGARSKEREQGLALRRRLVAARHRSSEVEVESTQARSNDGECQARSELTLIVRGNLCRAVAMLGRHLDDRPVDRSLNSGNTRIYLKWLLDEQTLRGAGAQPNSDNRIEKYSNIMETGNLDLLWKAARIGNLNSDRPACLPTQTISVRQAGFEPSSFPHSGQLPLLPNLCPIPLRGVMRHWNADSVMRPLSSGLQA